MFQRAVHAVQNRLFQVSQRDRAMPRDDRGQFHSAFGRLARLYHLVHKAKFPRLASRDYPARHQHIHSPGTTNEPGQALSSAVPGHRAIQNLCHGESGVAIRDAQIAGERYLQSLIMNSTLNRADYGLLYVGDGLSDPERTGHRLAGDRGVKNFGRRAHAEIASARVQDRRPNIVALANFGRRVAQRIRILKANHPIGLRQI